MTDIEYVKSRIEYYEYFKRYYSAMTDRIVIPCAPKSSEIEDKLARYNSILSTLESGK